MRTSVKITAYVLFSLLILLLTVLVAEFYFRTQPEYGKVGFVFDKKLIYHLTPNLTATKPYASNQVGKPPFTLRFNELGFRGPDIGTKDEQVQRILMLGDSYQAGLDYPDGEIFVDRWEQILNTSGNYEVINASCPAWGTDQHYILWNEKGKDLNPDHVVFCFSPNDIREMYNHGIVKLNAQDQIETVVAELPKDERRGWYWASKSSFFNYLQKNTLKTNYGDFPKVFHYYPVNYGKMDSTDWDMPLFLKDPIAEVHNSYALFSRLIAEIQSDCKKMGASLHLVKLPIKIEFDSTYQDSIFSKEIVTENISRIADSLDIPFINLNEELSKVENPLDIFMDWEYHYDQEGHQWVAQQLGRHIKL